MKKSIREMVVCLALTMMAGTFAVPAANAASLSSFGTDVAAEKKL